MTVKTQPSRKQDKSTRFRRPPLWAALFTSGASIVVAWSALPLLVCALLYLTLFIWLNGLYLFNHAKGAILGLVLGGLIMGSVTTMIYYFGNHKVGGYALAIISLITYAIAFISTEKSAKNGNAANSGNIYHRYCDAIQKGRHPIVAMLGLAAILLGCYWAYGAYMGYYLIADWPVYMCSSALVIFGIKHVTFSLKAGRMPWFIGGALIYQRSAKANRKGSNTNSMTSEQSHHGATTKVEYMTDDPLYSDAGTMDLSDTWS